VIAAATSSLPERVGGSRNWDYRYCWLRDASLTLQAFLDLGRRDEAHAFFSWMLHSTRLTNPELQVLYDVHGESRLPERELDHLEGYRGSRPVRVGNGAHGQLQLDVYGEVADAAAQYVRRGGSLGRASAKLLAGLGDVVCKRWREPDEGIWEVRSGRQHHTYSKVMCWVALDRLLELHEGGHLKVPVKRLAAARRAIHEEVEARGFDEKLGSYVSILDGDDVDASLLLLIRYGYVESESKRASGTYERIEERLGTHGLLYRYRGLDDGISGGEAAFGIASFWQVDALCRLGRVDEAAERFDHLCGFANDVGLFAEEIDPESGECLGNFPQAFTHAGLIDAGLTLDAALRGDHEGREAPSPDATEEREV
jgi:GH15 family glucan-1,4-alpha-glucosidase